MKKIVLLITLICIMTMISKSYSSNISKDEYTSYLKRNEEMVSLSVKIDNEMLKNNNEYPSYYGGMYIDEGAYNLVLQIVEDNIPNKEESQYFLYDKVIHMDDKIIIQYVKNKYSDLLNVYNEINNYYEEVNYDTTKREFNEFSSYYIDVKSNSVIVLFNNKLLVDNEKEIIQNNLEEKFKKNVVDSSVISFGFGNELVLESSSLNAGQGIKTNNVNNNCSMGYRTKINNKKGYITSAHCFTGVGVSSTGGVVTKHQRSGKVDAAFVETTASYEPSNVLKYPSNGITELNIAKWPTLKVGSTIAHNGVATNYQSGTILATNYAANYDGVSYTNLIDVNYTSSGGDSGGVVFVPTTSGGLIAGIHMEKINDTIKVVVNANNITEAFNDEWY